ncbi:ABC transporter permease [Sinirhodobacter sp. WL0062]|uniref:ABC transporter permease n=1 Tax=Rhodobacter flavimaris TaxID=2907145 RepID=A0ABS8Z5J5_9RHOB|nr:ABC transporter permease [Sinirhodobacter sp. WL0062]MCE5975215.1 ABC transporter permease [Sinirhodobacter sp. WL0062]
MKMILGRFAILAAILGFWEFASGRFMEPYLISTPSKIMTTFWAWLMDGRIFFHAGITALEAVAGFILGAAVGMTLGILLGRAEKLAELLNPFIMGFYSIPKIALAPLFIIWFGIGLEMKILLTATIVFFLVFLNTYTGVRSVSPELVNILRLMGANERHVLRKVVVPSAIVWVFTGLRLSVPYAMIGAIVGEMIAANRGLGYLLSHASAQFNTAGVFAALFAIITLSVLMNTAVGIVAKYAMPWEKAQKKREVSI